MTKVGGKAELGEWSYFGSLRAARRVHQEVRAHSGHKIAIADAGELIALATQIRRLSAREAFNYLLIIV